MKIGLVQLTGELEGESSKWLFRERIGLNVFQSWKFSKEKQFSAGARDFYLSHTIIPTLVIPHIGQ